MKNSAGFSFLLVFLLLVGDSDAGDLTSDQLPPISDNDSLQSCPLEKCDKQCHIRDMRLKILMSLTKIPGAVLLNIQNGEIEEVRSYGYADLEMRRRVTPDTLFTLASISKTVTATALMTLYEQGKFDLDDSIDPFLPFVVRNPNFPEMPITFRMLLTHTSSIRDSSAYAASYTLIQSSGTPDSPIALEYFLNDYLNSDGSLYSAEENFHPDQPGTRFEYANIGFGLVGYLVEQISGMPFDQYCRMAIFEPLGMEHTAWFFRDVDTEKMAIPYGYDEEKKQPLVYGFYGYPTYPDGALKTSAIEFARFIGIFLNDGRTMEGKRFLLPSTIDTMLTAHTLPGLPPSNAIGLPWFFEDGIYSHDGGDPGITTIAGFNPNTGRAFLLFSNGGGETSTLPGMIRSGIFSFGIQKLMVNQLSHGLSS